MKNNCAALIFSLSLFGFATATAQQPQTSADVVNKAETTQTLQPQAGAKVEPNAAQPTVEPDKTQTATAALSDEEAAVVPYYSNFMKEYRLGVEDVISVEVFGQPNYSKINITIPPDGTISYPLIRDGVFVVGKTRRQVAAEITKKLDEYIIDPKVTVSLDKAMSKRYSVLGDAAKPGAQIMTRSLTVYEAIAEAGGVLPTGNQREVIVLRSSADGKLSPITVSVKLDKKNPMQMMYLEPGDQIIVQGNRIKKYQQIMGMLPIIGFARGMMTGGAF